MSQNNKFWCLTCVNRHIIEKSFVKDNVVTHVSIISKDNETIGHVIISFPKLIKIALINGQKNYTNTFILYSFQFEFVGVHLII